MPRAVLTLVALLVAAQAAAAPKWVRLSFTEDTTTSVTVTWNTDLDSSSEVKVGTSPGVYDATVTGTSFQANAGLGWVHEVTLADLAAATRYYYAAGSADDGYAAEREFRTGPVQDASCGAFTFAFLGDNRPDPTFGGGQNWPQILAQANGHGPGFVVNGGDLVIDGPQIDQWQSFLGWTTEVASTTPFMPALGNHDNGPGEGDTANYNQLFSLPRATGTHGSGTEDYYYFTYGNAIFVALSTDSFKGGPIPFADQAAWLDEVLTQNPRRWRFVYYHKPSYSSVMFYSATHPPNEESQNAALVAILDKHHVDVAFTSHNHWYERYQPSSCATQGNAGSSDPCPVGADNFAGGTVYYVSGGAGAFTIPAILCGAAPGREACDGSHHYLLGTIQNETLTLETWSAFPQANQVIDRITIAKTPTTPCIPAPTDGGTPPADGPVPPADGARDAPAPPDDSAPPPDGPGPSGDGATPGRDAGANAASPAGGCGCRAVGGASSWAALGVLLGWRRRRR
jgi:hypothetical protein